MVFLSTFITHHYLHVVILLLGLFYLFYKKNTVGVILFFLLWICFTCVSYYCIHFYVYSTYPELVGIRNAMHFMLYGDFNFEVLAEQIIKEPPVLKKFLCVIMCFLMANHIFVLILLIGMAKFIYYKEYVNLLLFFCSWYTIMSVIIQLTLA